MAAVYLHNALFSPEGPLSSTGGGHAHNRSSTSTTSGLTSSGSDMLSARHLIRPSGDQQAYPMASEMSIQPHHSLIQQENKRPRERRLQTFSRKWVAVRITLSLALLVWVTYCTARYFVAFRIYGNDFVRSRYALGMGITSAITVLFFGSEVVAIFQFFDDRLLRRLIRSLTYLASVLVITITILNLVLIFHWRRPHGPADFGRSIQGRCNWDLDVVWSGTGMACAGGHAMPFGDWLGAAIARLVITAVLLVAYHLAVHGHIAATHLLRGSATFDDHSDGRYHGNEPSAINDSPPSRFTHGPLMHESPGGAIKTITVSEDELQRRSLSFTTAGQVLSRIEGSDIDQEEDAASSSESFDDDPALPRRLRDSPEPLRMSENPEPFSRPSSQLPTSADWYAEFNALPPNPPPSSYHRPIATPANNLQDFASAFQNLVSDINHDTQEGMRLDGEPSREHHDTVRVLGSYISRMSTIESLASREAGSSVRTESPTRSNTTPSLASGSGPGSGSLSRDPTLSSRGRERDEATSSPERSSFEG